jgi:MFS family permease
MSIIFVIWGLMGGMGGQVFVVLISQIIPLKVRGAVLGSYNFMGFVSATIGPVIFGYVADVLGFTVFFQLALALQLCGFIIVLLMMKLRHNIEAYSKLL